MSRERRALRAWEAHLEEVIGMDDAAVLADRFDRFVTKDYLDEALRRQSQELLERMDEKSEQLAERLTASLTAAWRRDLLLISVGQFFALAAAVAALVTLG